MNENFLLPDERIDEVNERLKLIQKKDGLTFGTDAYLLASYIKPQKKSRAAELGAGTGIISLLLATKERFESIHAFEIQKDFAELTARNISLNSLDGIISVHQADVRDISPLDFGGEFDVVFSNPPYMLTTSGKANMSIAKNIARHEVCGGISDFCAAARRLLKFGGKFYCVWRPDRLTALFSALASNGLEPKKMTFVHADLSTQPSMILLCATKGGAPSLEITPPLILHNEFCGESARELTDQAKKIYSTMSFD